MQEEATASSTSHSPTQEVNGENFRDHIPTADPSGKRIWIYPKKPKGTLHTWRTRVSWLLLAVLFIGPFVRINGNPLLMFNIPERKFSFFGQLFWPQDFFLFALAFLIIFIMIVLSTAVFGRVWCGWLCPQTVLMEMVFRKIEYWIEGDADAQRRLSKAPWNGEKFRKRFSKHAIFFFLSFLVGNLLLAYIVGSERLIEIVTDPPSQHSKGLTAMVLFSLLFYGIFARFREQACTFICPYGRFQSVLLDEQSIVVAYDNKRGENRGRFSKKIPREDRQTQGVGDCIDCGQCVRVCPTGIDIRNGTQMECVNCTACIDACNDVMAKLHFPRGLIRYASLNSIEKGEKLKVTPRLIVYSSILLVLTILLGSLLIKRTDVDASMLRSPGTLYQTLPGGKISNLYLVKVRNKSAKDLAVEFKMENVEGTIKVAGGQLTAKAREQAETAMIIEIAPDHLTSDLTAIEMGVYLEGEKVRTLKSNFMGPTKKDSP